jgi:hypothetical protein
VNDGGDIEEMQVIEEKKGRTSPIPPRIIRRPPKKK